MSFVGWMMVILSGVGGGVGMSVGTGSSSGDGLGLLRARSVAFAEGRPSLAGKKPKNVVGCHDLVVVGAGIAGTSVALFAKRLNPAASVLLLDADSIAAGASSHSAGTVWLPQSLKRRNSSQSRLIVDREDDGTSASENNLSEGDVSPHWDEVLSSATVDAYAELEAAGYDCELERSGALLVADSPEQALYVAAMFLDLAARGYDCKRDREDDSRSRLELLEDPESLLKVESRLRVFRPGAETNNNGVYSALHLPASVHVDTNKATLAFGEAAMDAGVEFRPDSKVVKIDKGTTSWNLTLEDGTSISTSRIVLACGATVSRLLPEAKVVVPVKGQIVQSSIALPDGWLKKIIFSASAHTDFASGKARSLDVEARIPPECTHDVNGRAMTRHLYGRQRRDGHVIMGGGRIPRPSYETHGLDYQVDEAVLRGVVQHCREVIRDEDDELAMGQEEIRSNSWACFMPFSMDGRPLYGPVDDRPGLFLALGLGPEGMVSH